jgi:DNA-binding NarL/FixJ family response regulator
VSFGSDPSYGEVVVTGRAVTNVVVVTTSMMSDAIGSLTSRQLEVLGLMAEGRSNAGIAAQLHLSEKAVVQHTSGIYEAFELSVDSEDNRRVLAVVRYLAAARDDERDVVSGAGTL